MVCVSPISKSASGFTLTSSSTRTGRMQKAAGLLRGGYHYLVWDRDPLEQADAFCALLKSDPGELPPAADFEERSGVPSNASEQLKRFLTAVEYHLGRRTAIYTSPEFLEEPRFNRSILGGIFPVDRQLPGQPADHPHTVEGVFLLAAYQQRGRRLLRLRLARGGYEPVQRRDLCQINVNAASNIRPGYPAGKS